MDDEMDVLARLTPGMETGFGIWGKETELMSEMERNGLENSFISTRTLLNILIGDDLCPTSDFLQEMV